VLYDGCLGGARATRRHALLLLSSGLVVTAPSLAQVSPATRVFRIGLLGGSSRTSPEASHIWGGLFEGLRALGYVEGRNIVVEERWYGEKIGRLPALADDLVRLRVDVIVVGTQPAPEEARRATSTIPIVMLNHGDPVGSGLVGSLAEPGGNVTGMSLNGLELRGKQLQLLKEAVPQIATVGILSNPTVKFGELEMRELESAARALKMRLQLVEARAPGEFAEAFEMAKRNMADAIMVLGNSLYFSYRERIVELARKSRLPAMYGPKEFAEAGGLMAYGVNFRDTARQAAGYVDKILRGASPSALPIEQPTRFELVINLKAAKQLGLIIPRSLLSRADRIIE
jgi:putative ABC transport system substrate-binding protein